MGENVEFSSLSSIKSCPVCCKGLERGYVTSSREIVWDTRKRIFTTFKAKEKLKSQWDFYFTNFPTLKCDDCKIVISYYGKEKKE